MPNLIARATMGIFSSKSAQLSGFAITDTGDGVTWTITADDAVADATLILQDWSLLTEVAACKQGGKVTGLVAGRSYKLAQIDVANKKAISEYTADCVPAPELAAVSAPAQPTLTVTDNADGTGASIVIMGADATATIRVYYFADASTSISTIAGTCTGNDTIAAHITSAGVYWFYATAHTATGYSVSENLVRLDVTDGSATFSSGEAAAIYEGGSGTQATVQSVSRTRETTGAISEAWTTSQTVYCWKQPIGSRLKTDYANRNLSVTHKVFIATDPDCSEGDRLIISGVNYGIRGVIDQAGMGELWRLDVEELK